MKGALPATTLRGGILRHLRARAADTVAVASSLTELFAPKIHKERISGMLENYDFIDDKVMAYFKRRLTQAPRDADFALDYVLKNAKTRERAGSLRRRRPLQVQRAVGAARRAASRLRRGAHSAGRIPSGGLRMGETAPRQRAIITVAEQAGDATPYQDAA